MGTPLSFVLIGGEVSDITQTETLLARWSATHVIADKGYDADAPIAVIQRHGAFAFIPSRSNKQPRELDTRLYRERHLIECWFNKLKHFRQVFFRFEKKVETFLSFVYLTALLIKFR